MHDFTCFNRILIELLWKIHRYVYEFRDTRFLCREEECLLVQPQMRNFCKDFRILALDSVSMFCDLAVELATLVEGCNQSGNLFFFTLFFLKKFGNFTHMHDGALIVS